MGADAVGAGQLGLGAIGAMQTKGRQESADRYNASAARVLGEQGDIMKHMKGLAAGYDPSKETAASVGYARSVAGDTLEKVLKHLNQQFSNANGSPTGDTAFQVNEAAQSNRIIDPLKSFAANQRASEFERTMNAWKMALSANPGQMADSYMRLSSQYNTDPSGAIDMFLSGLNKLTNKKGKGASAPTQQMSGGTGANGAPPDLRAYIDSQFANLGDTASSNKGYSYDLSSGQDPISSYINYLSGQN